jgi:hypothetical protein
MKAWDVYIPSSVYSNMQQCGLPDLDYGSWRHIDTVFFSVDCSREYVRQSLINHDGYSQNIQILRSYGNE